MKIVDLTLDYSKFLAGETSFEKYRAENAAIFDHYLKFWSGGDNVVPTLSIDEIEIRRALLLDHLAAAEILLREHGFSTDDVNVVLFVGNNSANGHAFLDTGKPVAWFAIECFKSDLDAKVFTMHELIHALHYAAFPGFAFNDVREQRNVARQLITEGIATYLTKHLLNVTDEIALWADKLPNSQIHSWMIRCQHCERELFLFIATHFDSSDPSIQIFYAANPEDIHSYRAGYYVGLKLIESIAAKNDFSARDLLNLPMQEMKQFVWNELQSFISN